MLRVASVQLHRQLHDAIGQAEYLLAAKVSGADELLACRRQHAAQEELLGLFVAKGGFYWLVEQPTHQGLYFDEDGQRLLFVSEAAHQRGIDLAVPGFTVEAGRIYRVLSDFSHGRAI